jgi:hypothetical protein
MESLKKSFIMVLMLQGLMFVGCGEVESSSKEKAPSETEVLDTTDTIINNSTKDFFLAKDNTLHDVNSSFGKFNVVVYADKKLDNTPSNATKAIYGKINGLPTNALLSINSQYKNGTSFIVKVFKNNKLVGESKKSILSGGTLEFSDITTK